MRSLPEAGGRGVSERRVVWRSQLGRRALFPVIPGNNESMLRFARAPQPASGHLLPQAGEGLGPFCVRPCPAPAPYNARPMRLFLQHRPDGHDAPRFVQLMLQPDLFGGWSLVRETGQMGGRSTVRREQFPDHPSALAALEHASDQRSEEHTSELQSLMRITYADFCLKKKKIQ